jgi:hypothetical protein
MIQAEVAHHSAEGATVGPSVMNELRLASHAKFERVAAGKPSERITPAQVGQPKPGSSHERRTWTVLRLVC